MTVASTDVKFKKSAVVTNTTTNGGRKGQVIILNGARHALFPRVTKKERADGVERYRKKFICNENANDESMYGVLAWLECPSNSDDRFYIGAGQQNDTQADLDDYSPAWTGTGQLETALSGGESEISITMENDDFQFEPGGYLHIANKFKTGQTIDSGVNVGDSVLYSGGSWGKITTTTDIEYPNGLYVGDNTVMTDDSSDEEWLRMSDHHYANEILGTGNGSSLSPTLAQLTHHDKGICRLPGFLPAIRTVCGGVARTVNVDADGLCSGYCTAGQLDMDDGSWDTNLAWTSAPDNGAGISGEYRENNFEYSGNVVTIDLEDQVANSFDVADTYAGGCIYLDELITSFASWVETSASGTYNETTYPPLLYNDGTEYDIFTLTFSNATTFVCSGVYNGSVGTGTTASDFSPINPNTGQPFFTIRALGWGGSWTAGDKIVFITNPSAMALWLKEIVPSGAGVENYNLLAVGIYSE
jgi:hypothetical protein